jgi:hypothetical protein
MHLWSKKNAYPKTSMTYMVQKIKNPNFSAFAEKETKLNHIQYTKYKHRLF